MRELSIFVDESGDWGEYRHHSPYYIITFVFHDQDIDISNDLSFKVIFGFKNIKVYYDNGQTEVNKILSSVLNVLHDNEDFLKNVSKELQGDKDIVLAAMPQGTPRHI